VAGRSVRPTPVKRPYEQATHACGIHWTRDWIKQCGDLAELEQFADAQDRAVRQCAICTV
jgi:hypothetical protein